MKKLSKIRVVGSLLIAAAFIYSCENSVDEFDGSDTALSLKSASVGKVSYIVTLDDQELAQELSAASDYNGKKDKVAAAAAKLLNKLEVTDSELGYVYAVAIKGFSVKLPKGQLKKLEGEPTIVRIEEDKVISLSPIVLNGKPGSTTTTTPPKQTTPWGITRVRGGANGVGKTVWVIDTGVDFVHPDLTVDKDRSVNYSSDKETYDLNGHGTHVAGTIAALDNEIGVVGVAAGATVVSVKVLNRRGSGTISGVIAGIDYVAAKAPAGDVANMSLGGGVSTTLDNAVISAAGKEIKFALAAGNETDDAINHSPARAEHANIYTISAMDSSDKFAYFSNYGSVVDYCEPGVKIYSTYKSGGYATLSGTSMAAPHMAGLLLLGPISTDGTVANDPDTKPDPIGVH